MEERDLLGLLRDTVLEAMRSWRLPATTVLGVALGTMEFHHTRSALGFAFGLVAALYTLLLGPLPWRALVPLEADGRRWSKLLRGLGAGALGTALFTALVLAYRWALGLQHLSSFSVASWRQLGVSYMLFHVGGWGLARDIQLEQRLDRTLGSHERLTAELAEARLHALRADLDPHFLFNALNAIASQCATDPRAAEENVVRLATLLRAVLDTRRRPLHPLEEELSLAQDYTGLLAARFPSLTVRWDIDPEARSLEVPPLLLQPLLENALRHGRADEGPIAVGAHRTATALVLTVRNPGGYEGPRSGGMGLELVQRRVELAWGQGATFEIRAEGGDTLATITAPLKV